MVVVEGLPPGASPTAVIHIWQNNRDKRASLPLHPCMVRVRVSLSRLSTLLGRSDAAERILAMLRRNRADISVKNCELVRRIRDEILESTHEPASFHLLIQAKAIELLVNGVASVSQAVETPPSLVSAAVDRLLLSPLNPPTMAELASSLSISPRTLSTKFKSFFGVSVPEWLAEWRMHRGWELVIEDSLPLAEIAASLGYAHLSNFTSAFSRRFGLPPGRVRSSRHRFEQSAMTACAVNANSHPISTALVETSPIEIQHITVK